MPITFITFEDGVSALHGLLVMPVVCLVNQISKLQNHKQCTHKHERRHSKASTPDISPPKTNLKPESVLKKKLLPKTNPIEFDHVVNI